MPRKWVGGGALNRAGVLIRMNTVCLKEIYNLFEYKALILIISSYMTRHLATCKQNRIHLAWRRNPS